MVTPIYKKGSRHDPANYRPVSLTTVCCKVLEHVICKHILDHLDKHGILTDLQHGFRSGFSCETQLLITSHDILKNFDNKVQTDVIILDFSKAFDTVPHDRLLTKLEHLGIDGKINSWMQAFLTNRSQQVVVDGEASDPVSVDSGVPQGSVLGPLLFTSMTCQTGLTQDHRSGCSRMIACCIVKLDVRKTMQSYNKISKH